jgi:hypothetical protein
MVGGQHQTDEATQSPSVKGEHTNARIAIAALRSSGHGCAQRRPTPKEKALATADLVREIPLIEGYPNLGAQCTSEAASVR